VGRRPDGFFCSFFGASADTLPPYWLAMMASVFGVPVDTDEDTLAYEPMVFNVEDVTVSVDAWYGDQDRLLAAGQEPRPGNSGGRCSEASTGER
jgi:hypothetical protein